MTTTNQPVTLAARERLRDQQRREAVQLDAVLSAERRVHAEQRRAADVAAKARQAVALKQAALDDAVVELVSISGLARAALLLGREQRDLVRLTRSRRRDHR